MKSTPDFWKLHDKEDVTGWGRWVDEMCEDDDDFDCQQSLQTCQNVAIVTIVWMAVFSALRHYGWI